MNFFHQHHVNQTPFQKKKPLFEADEPNSESSSDKAKLDDTNLLTTTLSSLSTPVHEFDETAPSSGTKDKEKDRERDKEMMTTPTKTPSVRISNPMHDSLIMYSTPHKSPAPRQSLIVKQFLQSPLPPIFACTRCGATGHLQDSLFCRTCGSYIRDNGIK